MNSLAAMTSASSAATASATASLTSRLRRTNLAVGRGITLAGRLGCLAGPRPVAEDVLMARKPARGGV
jgi:hypothetical protein